MDIQRGKMDIIQFTDFQNFPGPAKKITCFPGYHTKYTIHENA